MIKKEYSQLSPCGHLAYYGQPIRGLDGVPEKKLHGQASANAVTH